jgi:radical SAM protein with 4Fe4S-binding SPASM domain
MADLQQRLFQVAAQRHIPLAAHVDLTYRCNFRCTHCYLPEHGGPEMSTDEVLSVLDELARVGTMFLVLSGGEVFLRRDLFQILERTRRLGFHVRLFTDGYLIDERNADRLAALHIPQVHVSLYSLRPEAFDAITLVPGSLHRVLRAIELLRERNIAVTVKCPVMQDTAEDVLGVLSWARARGCDTRTDTAIIPQRDGCVDPVLQHTLDRGTLRSVMEQLSAANAQPVVPYAPGSRDEWPMCGAGRSTVHVEPSGNVNPCVLLPKAAGNVHERRFRDIWTESPTLQKIRGYRQKDRKGCRGCMNMGFCGFCMGKAYLSTGDELSPAGVLCHQAHTRASFFRGVDATARPSQVGASLPWEAPREASGCACAAGPVVSEQQETLVQIKTRPRAVLEEQASQDAFA